MVTDVVKDMRCDRCHKLLAEKAGKGTVITCSRCGQKNST